MTIFGYALSDILKLLAGIIGAATAVTSAMLSILNFRRDQGRLDVSVSRGTVYAGQTATEVVSVSVINVGRRPVVLTGIGGRRRFSFIRRLVGLIDWKNFPKVKAFALTHYFVNHTPETKAEFFTQNGQCRRLNEAEGFTAVLNLKPYGADFAKNIAGNASFGVFDNLGRRHDMPARAMRNLRKYLRD